MEMFVAQGCKPMTHWVDGVENQFLVGISIVDEGLRETTLYNLAGKQLMFIYFSHFIPCYPLYILTFLD
jgi:hypothetical protein